MAQRGREGESEGHRKAKNPLIDLVHCGVHGSGQNGSTLAGLIPSRALNLNLHSEMS